MRHCKKKVLQMGNVEDDGDAANVVNRGKRNMDIVFTSEVRRDASH